MALFAVFAVPWALELFPHMTGVPALFDKESIIYHGQEAWLFEKSNELQEALDFFFIMRKKLKGKRINNEC